MKSHGLNGFSRTCICTGHGFGRMGMDWIKLSLVKDQKVKSYGFNWFSRPCIYIGLASARDMDLVEWGWFGLS